MREGKAATDGVLDSGIRSMGDDAWDIP